MGDVVQNYYSAAPTGRFGDYRTPTRRHRGVDMSHSTRPGTIPVPSLRPGRVVSKTVPSSFHGFGHGITIRSILDDGNEWDISYSHAPWASSQQIGEQVAAGQYIVHEGSTGATQGSCVHIEQKRVSTGVFVDPLPEIQRMAQRGIGSAPSPTPAPAPAPQPSGGQPAVAGVHGPNPFGIPFTGGLQKISKLYGYKGKLDQDWGGDSPAAAASSGSMAGFVAYLTANWGYRGNRELGPNMWAAIARWLRARYGYVGDDIPGPQMRAALNRADTANWQQLA